MYRYQKIADGAEKLEWRPRTRRRSWKASHKKVDRKPREGYRDPLYVRCTEAIDVTVLGEAYDQNSGRLLTETMMIIMVILGCKYLENILTSSA